MWSPRNISNGVNWNLSLNKDISKIQKVHNNVTNTAAQSVYCYLYIASLINKIYKLIAEHNFTYLHVLNYSTVQSPSWEANRFATSQKIPRISRNPKVHYRNHNRPPHVSILGQPNPVHIPTSLLLEIHPNIIHPSTPRSPQWSPSLRFPHQDPIHPLSSPIRATCPAHLILLDFITCAILGEQYKSSYTCSYSFPLCESQNIRTHCQKCRIFMTWKPRNIGIMLKLIFQDTGTLLFETHKAGTVPWRQWRIGTLLAESNYMMIMKSVSRARIQACQIADDFIIFALHEPGKHRPR